MDKDKEQSIHHTALKICEDLQLVPAYRNLYENIQKLVATPAVKLDNFKETLTKAVKDTGLENELRNNIYHWVRSKKKTHNSELDSYFAKAQLAWDKKINKSLVSMGAELGMHLARFRANNDKEEMQEKWGELSKYVTEMNKYRPIYAPKDLFEVVVALRGPNYNPKKKTRYRFSHLPMKVKTFQELRTLYVELARGEQILGTNLPNYAAANYAAFELERIQLGEKVLANNYAPVAQEYLKRGCPRCLRARLWTLVLGTNVKQTEYEHFEELKSKILQFDLLTDKLFMKDIHLTASNDDQYFVFEDVLYQVMLCFSRDSEVLQLLPEPSGCMPVTLKGKQQLTENTLMYPPNGVIPFYGFTMYAAPFCYLFDDNVALYYVFRAFYLRYFHRLHKICTHPQSIVALCLLYERLLQCFEPNLWSHFRKYRIHPVRVVFKWIVKAFSGHLPPEQVLNLWDLILAYDSLEIIPFLAVIILIFRKDNLMKVNTIQSIDAVLSDLSSITVIPLLQMALLKD